MGQILFDSLERNKQQFIESANNKHNNKYDYSLINYINTHTKVKIICPIHGVFEQTPSRHLNSNGCNKCRIQKISNLDEFINKSRKIHGDLYDYSLVNYTNNDTPVIIICKKHGEFQVRPRSHTSSKSGCPKCWKKYDLSPIDRSKIKFNNKFTYNNGLVICPIHGNTGYSIHEHLKTTHGCNKCYEDSRRMLIPEYLERANKIHNNKYQYELLNFKSVSDEIKIICPIHGEFKQKAGAHLYEKKGCRQCSHNKMSLEEFINKAIEIHGNKYDYSKVVYNGIDSKIDIICKKHGLFKQRPIYHLSGNIGCRRCNSSMLQEKIINELKDEEIIICDRNIIKPYEIDIYLPEHSLGIETHGNYFHSYNHLESTKERYRHYTKANLANNIKLLQFFEHEIDNKWPIVKSMINHYVNKSNKIYARDCEVKILNYKEAYNFLEESHINGFIPATVYYGLTLNSDIISIASFTNKKQCWEISRYATKLNNCIVGGFSKLLKRFIIEQKPNNLYTFADRRFSKAKVYKLNGFEVISITKPNYIYLDTSGKYVGTRQQFQKHKLQKILPVFHKELTEAENMFVNGYRRLWDAGHYKLRYKIKN